MSSSKSNNLSTFIALVKEHENADVFKNITSGQKQELYNICWEFIQSRTTNAKIEIISLHGSDFLLLNMPDMPFIVDSVRMALSNLEQDVKSFLNMAEIAVKRSKGQLNAIQTGNDMEAILIVELDKVCDKNRQHIISTISSVVDDVMLAVEDWQPMQAKMNDCINAIRTNNCSNITQEAVDFSEWLKQHFTFFGFRSYVVSADNAKELHLEQKSALGVLRDKNSSLAGYAPSSEVTSYSPEGIEEFIIVGKSKYRSTIHRPVYTDVIIVRMHDAKQKFIGEYRFFGLFTSNAYESDPMVIPFLRHKSKAILANMIKKTQLTEGYTSKKIKQFIRSIPRDELFQADVSELVNMVSNALALQNNTSIKAIIRRDKFKRFITMMLYLPKNNHTHSRCEAIAKYLQETYQPDEISHQNTLLDLQHICVHYVLRTPEQSDSEIDDEHVKAHVIKMSRTWEDLLRMHLSDSESINSKKYIFSSNFKELFSPEQALNDLSFLSQISEQDPIKLNMVVNSDTGLVHIRSYQWKQNLALSEALPIFENLGFELKHEAGAAVIGENHTPHWISEFTAKPIIPLGENNGLLKGIINTFYRVLAKEASNDSFNQLGLRSGLQWYEIRVVRTIANYLKQIGFSLSIDYIANTMNQYPEISGELIQLFKIKFALSEPASTREAKYAKQLTKVMSLIESVMYVDEDKIFRAFISVINAVVRTNAYKLDADKKRQSYLSLKIHSADVQDMPLPAPKFEIFTFSHRFMGIHLRADMVARGGLRWSDREDFRKEILDLMKAQQVKNSLIVPAGAKGGFVLKRNLNNLSVKEVQEEAIACYKLFISSLLDLTHNLVKGEVIAPNQIVCHDEADSYLVVAADKGTSTFSDIANSISEDKYNFWLKDAFATGGSKGYDHKKMGITSRGAWESVKWHFRELGEIIDQRPFTVVGIGGMAGDVFGNGMLLSKQIKLVAAFNHKFIFLDPNPDPAISYKERQRLFNLPDCMWSDYNSKLISNGGGIFSRFDKRIPLSPEVCQVLGLPETESMAPTDLIKSLLKAPVDLIWNGGIGTYVKSKSETDADVCDHANDRLRVNGEDLRCKIFGEGGNLGMTQLARAEAEFSGVKLNTDFIDNSAGVDCSDHEVNIKILLNAMVDHNELTLDDRDKWLVKMTDEVAELVLENNKLQNLSISIAANMLPENLHLFERFIEWAVSKNYLNREIEYLPSSDELRERFAVGKSFSRSELATLLSYSKIILQKQILAGDFTDLPIAATYVYKAFPKSMIKLFGNKMLQHPLKQQIIATQLSSDFVQNLGITFIPEVIEEIDVAVEDILSAFLFIKEFYNMPSIISCLERNEHIIPHDLYMKIWQNLRLLMRRSTRWLLRNRSINSNDKKLLARYLKEKTTIQELLPKLATGQPKKLYSKMMKKLDAFSLSKEDRELLSRPLLEFSALNIIDSAINYKADVKDITAVHFLVFDKMKTDMLRIATSYNNFSSRWSVISRFKVKGDIDSLQRDLTGIFYRNCYEKNIKKCQHNIEYRHADLLQSWQKYALLLQPDARLDFEVIFVMISELKRIKSELEDYYKTVKN